jgi:hypothetical protein
MFVYFYFSRKAGLWARIVLKMTDSTVLTVSVCLDEQMV